MTGLSVEMGETTSLVFDDGAPVRAASGIARLGDGWLVCQDDATAAAWWAGASVRPVGVFPPVQGHDVFSESAGTKDLKPDLEAACALDGHAVLVLGSGSLPARMRAAVVRLGDGPPQVTVADLTPLYRTVAAAMGVPDDALNLEGADVFGSGLRWFQRGHAGAGVASASVDVALDELLEVFDGGRAPGDVRVAAPTRYDLGDHDGVALAITDVVALPDGRLLASAAAEDAPDAVADGPIVASAIALLDGDAVLDVRPLPAAPDGTVRKVEGLAVVGATSELVDVVAVMDQDDPDEPSTALSLRVGLP